MGGSTPVVVESTVLRCLGPHPYASRLPDRFGGRTHNVQIGFPLPFQCRPTGRVWTLDTAPLPVLPNGPLMIQARCACGAVTEYEIARGDA